MLPWIAVRTLPRARESRERATRSSASSPSRPAPKSAHWLDAARTPARKGRCVARALAALWLPTLSICLAAAAETSPEKALVFQSPPSVEFHLQGVLGERQRANVEQWLLRAPAANPGMIEMFRLRDRQPTPNLVPWAGEFVGKYLVSAIQALRLEEDGPRKAALRQTIANVVAQLIATQADDGYLGPFPKADRLQGNWDLWGHYHCMLALLMWHEASRDPAALNTCRRAADLVCATHLDTRRRVFDAGSHEMNMAIIHSLGWLRRLTGERRYERMMREIEKDWERAGDYLRSGLDGREFFQSPRPRWESLHDLQGLLELGWVDGDTRYRQAFEHHWRSILRWDRRNTGGFSSGEQATGNPYAPTAIETCCTVAWMVLSADMLRLTGDSRVADELELATYNGAAGAQHPSGRWWTYNTPMDGVREASAHTIVFQARAGTPELNCCSVNGPRSLGLLSEWAVMQAPDGWVVNAYEQGSFTLVGANRATLKLHCQSEYPRRGQVRLTVEAANPAPFGLRLRIPHWSARTAVDFRGGRVSNVQPGTYLALTNCRRGDTIRLDLDLDLRFVPGAQEATGKVSLYRGPLLLAYDQRFNDFDEANLPALDLARLDTARANDGAPGAPRVPDHLAEPWLLLRAPTKEGSALWLCDFATAGAGGTRYRSWLPAADCPPPPILTRTPADGASIPPGDALFRWTGPQRPSRAITHYRLVIREDGPDGKPALERSGLQENRLVLDATDARALRPDTWYGWEVISTNPHGSTTNGLPRVRFRVDPNLPPLSPEALAAFRAKTPEVLVAASLRGDPHPQTGRLLSATGAKPVLGRDGHLAGAVELDGVAGRLIYALAEFPEDDFSATVWVRPTKLPEGRLGQILSAWATGMDDPLRLCIDQGRVHARIEAGQGYSTEGVPIKVGEWFHVAAVKEGARLKLFVNGWLRAQTAAPLTVHTSARDFALGGNPHYGGNEFLAAQFAELMFYSRALTDTEVKALSAAR